MLAPMTDLASVAEVVIPIHPNPAVTGPAQAAVGNVKGVHLLPPSIIPPSSGCSANWLLGGATRAITDPEGVQEEAPAIGVPVLVMSSVTERGEGIATGNALLIGTVRMAIVAAAMQILGDAGAWALMAKPALPYRRGDAAVQIARLLVSRFGIAESTVRSSTQTFHHGDEARKACGDRPGIVDDDGVAGIEPQDGEAHGDTVIELGGHSGAAGNGFAA